MEWSAFLITSVVMLLLCVVLAIIHSRMRYKSGRILNPLRILFLGVILSSVCLFIPIYINAFKTSGCGLLESVLIAIYNMIRLFIIDGEFEFITENIADVSDWVFRGYTAMSAVLFVLAPLLTFGFVLSFFKNISAYLRYAAQFRTDAFVFSELNEKSLALAKSLCENKEKKRFLVFTGVLQEENQTNELAEKAKELGAVCFKKDILSVNFSFHSKRSQLNFFAMGTDESKNVDQALVLIEKLKHRENTNLYVFSTRIEAELLLANAFNSDGSQISEEGEKRRIKVRRVNEVRSLVNRTLYETGFEKVFSSAYPDENGVKRINAVVVGMGQHGTEMTKALAWFCQMTGYRLQINSFDTDKKAEERFVSLCPELMDSRFNGRFDVAGEASYKITVHSNVDVNTKSFDDIIMALPRTTYVFVALGDDGRNISTAVKLRALFERTGCTPAIQAVVYNADRKEALTGIRNYRNQEYKIDFIGDLRSSCSEAVILGSDVETAALNRHLKWGDENSFWQYDYNYKASIASAIHRKMKILCGIPGAEKAPEDRTEDELWSLRMLEHCRWNAYMRSEGYVYGGTVEKEGRNDLAKMHNCLVPFSELSLKEQMKDDD